MEMYCGIEEMCLCDFLSLDNEIETDLFSEPPAYLSSCSNYPFALSPMKYMDNPTQ